MGGQAGWLLGVALVGGAGILVSTRLKRSDARTGWLIAIGGAFLTTAVAFSFAQGIFHPYYVSLLAPFTGALVGAVGAHLAGGDARGEGGRAAGRGGRACSPSWRCSKNGSGGLDWLTGVLVFVGVAAVGGLMFVAAKRIRAAILAVALGALLIAPAAWSVQTLGHATSGTFPAGGSATASFGGAGRRRASAAAASAAARPAAASAARAATASR